MQAEAMTVATDKSQTMDHWCTPLEIVNSLIDFNGRRPALDPCSNPNSIVHAEIEWWGPDAGGTDGLVVPWETSGLVYVNPPYSDKFSWSQKCHDEAARGHEIISLLPGDTSTEWWHRYCAKATRICQWKGRLKFQGDRAHPARFPSVLVYWGPRAVKFERMFATHGAVWVPV